MTATRFPPLSERTDAASLLARIEAAGIVGMGGGGYPTAAKLRAARASGADLVIGNGMACEPGADADLALLRQRLDAVVSGLRIVCRCLAGGGRCEATPVRRQSEPNAKGPRFVLAVPPGSDIPPPATAVAAPYPAGDERVLVAQVAGREVPAAGWPTDVGVVVLNVATLFAIHEAVHFGRAPRRRLVTVGEANYWLRLGRPLATLRPLLAAEKQRRSQFFEHRQRRSGIRSDLAHTKANAPPLRVGGPLTGQPAATDAAVEATTFHVGLPPTSGPCIRCGWCRPACPEGLDPDLLHASFEATTPAPSALDCTECGACTAACPAAIDLVNEFRALKHRHCRATAAAHRANAARQRGEARAARLQQAAEARDDRRAERLRRPRRW